MRACPSCTATQAPQDADVELGVTQCASCGHVLVPLAAVLYYTAVRLVNRSTLLVADQGLVVTHGPLPWLQAEVALPRDEVLQLFVTEVRTRANKGGSDRFHYSLVARTTKQQLELLSGWNDPELLRGVESAAEARLRIDNHRVGGEHRGEGRGMP